MTPKAPQPAPAAAMPEPVRIPSAMDPDVMANRKQVTADEFMKRKGRDSTRLAGGPDGAYSRTTLG